MSKKNLLIINGSMSGAKGNCGSLIKSIKKMNGARQFKMTVSHLKQETKKQITKKLLASDILLFVTGTYWESWGSPMQKFLEDFTDLEATNAFVGKPAGFIVLCHSTGGRSVLSKLQANLNLFGCLLPPFCGVELSMVNQALIKNDPMNHHKDDLWQIQDIELVLTNLGTAAFFEGKYDVWPVDRKNFRKVWIKKYASYK